MTGIPSRGERRPNCQNLDGTEEDVLSRYILDLDARGFPRRRAKKTRIRLGGSLTAGEAEDLLAEKEIGDQLEQEMRRNGYAAKRGAGGKRLINTCHSQKKHPATS